MFNILKKYSYPLKLLTIYNPTDNLITFMKNLLEISKIVTKKKVKKIEIFDDHSLKHKNSKFNEFYNALLDGSFKNDRDAASLLYNSTPTSDKYRQLKSRFRKRLLNTLFFLDVNLPSASNYERAYFSCNKDWTLVRILHFNKAKLTASYLAKKILTTSLKFKFADVIVNCSRILRDYASEKENYVDFEMYNDYIHTYSKILNAEILSEELAQKVKNIHQRAASNIGEFESEISKYCYELIDLSEKYQSPIIFFNTSLAWVNYYDLINDYANMIEICNSALDYINNNPVYFQNSKLATFQLKKMSAYLHLKDWKNGKLNAERCINSFSKGSETWFSFMQNYALLAFHTENYINAIAIHKEVLAQSKFKKLPIIEKEKWNIIGIYLNYIIESLGDDFTILKTQSNTKFKLQQFLANPILHPPSQRVLTVHVIVAQILFLIEKKRFQGVTERIERLKNYSTRQFKKDEYYRINQFIRLLQQLKKANYNPSNLSNIEKYLVNLNAQPFNDKGKLYQFEIVPFEDLWNMILVRLNNSSSTGHYR